MKNKQKAPAKKPPAGGKANPRKFKPGNAPNAASSPKQAAEPAVKGQAIGNLGAVIVRNEFYRDGYRTVLKLALLQVLVIIGLVGSIFFVIHVHQPENRYFATTEDGRLIPMVALNEPNLSTPALMSWAAQAVAEVMTFGFNDYKRRLQESSRNFTRPGWDSFSKALEQSRIIEMVEKGQQIVTATPRGAPVIASEGVVSGRYQWVIDQPIALTYQRGATSQADNLMVRIVVVRVSRLESPNGVGIEQWIAGPG